MKLLVCAAALSFVLLSSCTSSEDVLDTGPSVTVRNDVFEPSTLTIKVGETVTWKWAEGVHNVVSGTSCKPDAKFTSGTPVSGATFEHRFDTAGTYDYFCEVHCQGGMVGKIVVQ